MIQQLMDHKPARKTNLETKLCVPPGSLNKYAFSKGWHESSIYGQGDSKYFFVFKEECAGFLRLSFGKNLYYAIS